MQGACESRDEMCTWTVGKENWGSSRKRLKKKKKKKKEKKRNKKSKKRKKEKNSGLSVCCS